MESSSTPARRGPKPKPHTRDNLIRAGVRMFHDAGYSATGIKEITDAVEVPKGSFYNHFESKEDFGREVADFYFGKGLVDLRAFFENEEIPPLERLKTYFDQRIQGFQSSGYVRGCLLGNLSLEVADHSQLIRDSLATHFRTWSRLFETCIADAQKSGAIHNRLPASVLAQFVLNSWEGAILRMRADKSDAPLKEFVEVVFSSLLV
ncbi:TetR/AcrR family transcriptional regulator [Aquitalea sp. LB_tupeE]|uniref:TetR/AcrR family transcriptional regulator n=1 Tax=Aquitalea sp. LB_tupeE TaxID=2748078 RepID=UPI0015BCA9AE|nr:TetR/AcrR family transcriptional regulator [Aquitalea sp. LB_tupeE]NWK80358.1 TetR family transcriptional regulator C-terminal domain-containing protein [Aquitalea sp. LB_tupeE]